MDVCIGFAFISYILMDLLYLIFRSNQRSIIGTLSYQIGVSIKDLLSLPINETTVCQLQRSLIVYKIKVISNTHKEMDYPPLISKYFC